MLLPRVTSHICTNNLRGVSLDTFWGCRWFCLVLTERAGGVRGGLLFHALWSGMNQVPSATGNAWHANGEGSGRAERETANTGCRFERRFASWGIGGGGVVPPLPGRRLALRPASGESEQGVGNI